MNIPGLDKHHYMKHIHENSHNSTSNKTGSEMQERSSTTSKNFQDFQRWQNDIVDNTVRHNSVDNGPYHGVRSMEDNALHPRYKPNETATSQGKP